ncbi:MAG: acetoin utilization protein AcuC [Bacteroidetes bacterium]|nr:acetoin utilization protein AcuC [Bacteroidota bacterium]MBU1116993.1 acetoin utilization protein AcuC [Bacteroidota bacterium]MBU1797329.1 acetoin utilization protein AcuC [Bacteroidota bacterium]
MCRVIYNPKYSMYNLGELHPFSPRRVEMLIELLKEWNVYKEPIEPNAINPVELEAIHDSKYIDAIEQVSSGAVLNGIDIFGLGNSDNPISLGMAEGARYQVGGTVLGAKLLIENKAKKVLQLGGGFHHAHHNLASGFCLYNDLSMAITEMVNHGWHVAYLDIDVHHGDGVQEMFYSNGNVMTISIHESGEYLFPGKGWLHELGQGSGRSLKLNIPLEPFSEGDSYFEVLEKVVKPALSWFKPDALVVQAGADAHFADPLADNLLTTHDYEKIFRQIIDYADKSCNGKVLFTLGGGYSSTATPRIWALLYLILNNLEMPEYLPENWKNHWEQILGKTIPNTLHDKLPAYEIIPRRDEILKINKDVIRRLMDSVSQYWI